jgi:hypothetical protein
MHIAVAPCSMFSTQPLLTCCLFGLPAGILAIICYTVCSADFSVEHEEVYPDDEDDEQRRLVDDEQPDDDDDHEKRE